MSFELELEKFLDIAMVEFGPAKFKYRKAHHRYNSRSKCHVVSCITHPEVTKEEYFKNIQNSKKLSMESFMGKLKCSYDEYRIEVSEPGYLQKIKEIIEEKIKKNMSK